MSRRVTTTAIAIQRFPYGETSQIVHFLTPDLGRVGVLVRGAFRPKNSYQGPIDLLVRGRIALSMLEHRELGLLLSREVETAYPALRRSLGRFRAARHLLEAIERTTPVGHGGEEVFRLFDRGLRALETVPPERVALLVLSYDLRLLRTLGLSPELGRCVRCGEEKKFSRFSAAEGGILCRDCARADEGVRLSKPAWELLRLLDATPLREVALPPKAALNHARNLLFSHLAYHLDWMPQDGPLRPRRSRVLRHA